MKNRTYQFAKKFNLNNHQIWFLKRVLQFSFLIGCFFSNFFYATAEAIDTSNNPFLIDFPEKEELTNNDYVVLQDKLRKINLNPLLSEYYAEMKNHSDVVLPYSYFYSRCAKFLYQEFINQKQIPRKRLIKINNGGDNCVVGAVPYAKDYPSLLLSQVKALRQTGFNGHYLIFLGAYPNPTGREVRYAGVPYAFKIFSMIEAQKLGFNKVLWLDSALYPKRDITPIFDEIEKTGFVAHHRQCAKDDEFLQMFSTTRELLYNLTSVDVLQGHRIFATMIGLKMNHPLTEQVVRQYYDFVEMGTPFISGLPEEFVLSAILGQEQFAGWMKASSEFENSLPAPCFRSTSSGQWVIPDQGYFFDWRVHRWVDNVNLDFSTSAPRKNGKHKGKS